MDNDAQTIIRTPPGKLELRLLSRISHLATFSSADARETMGPEQATTVSKLLDRLLEKGWIKRVQRGRFAVIPLSSGETRSPQLHEFIVAMELVKPAAIAYFSALNHHGFTEQLPATVFIATDHPVRRPRRQALGVTFQIISVRPKKYFGVRQDWLNEQPFKVTDKEKTIVDSLDLPEYAGGLSIIGPALRVHWDELDEPRLREYAGKIGNSAAAKRLGFLMESYRLGDTAALRDTVKLATGYPRLDPRLPPGGTFNRRWGLLINTKVSG
jgi:predicted transcriptional regulator of viral defense system